MQLSDAEWRIMTCLWQGSPASARDVLDRLGRKVGWAYTTVKTMLTRLAEKGAVKERIEGNVALYEPRITQREARRAALRSLVERAFGGAYGVFVHHLVADEKLSAKERAELDRLLHEARRGKSS
jgi:predicted transcriptional regulator